MDIITLLLLSVGLAMDASAVSIANGMCYNCLENYNRYKSPLAFGIAQAVMPLLGYFFGSLFAEYISFLDHWITLIILSFIGGKMILDAVKDYRSVKSVSSKKRELDSNTIFVQAIATSIDAFTVGVSFAVMNVNIFTAVVCIGVITFLCCTFCINLGSKLGSFAKEGAQILGGIILIFIGIRTFIEHTML